MVFVLKLFKFILLAAPGEEINVLIFDLFGPTDKFAFLTLLSNGNGCCPYLVLPCYYTTFFEFLALIFAPLKLF